MLEGGGGDVLVIVKFGMFVVDVCVRVHYRDDPTAVGINWLLPPSSRLEDRLHCVEKHTHTLVRVVSSG